MRAHTSRVQSVSHVFVAERAPIEVRSICTALLAVQNCPIRSRRAMSRSQRAIDAAMINAHIDATGQSSPVVESIVRNWLTKNSTVELTVGQTVMDVASTASSVSAEHLVTIDISESTPLS